MKWFVVTIPPRLALETKDVVPWLEEVVGSFEDDWVAVRAWPRVGIERVCFREESGAVLFRLKFGV